MNAYKASNVSLKDFIKFLEQMGAKKIRTTGGHYIFSHKDLKRPIPIQSHIDPVPKFIVLEVINYFNMSSKNMWEIIKPPKGTTKRSPGPARKGKRANKNKK